MCLKGMPSWPRDSVWITYRLGLSDGRDMQLYEPSWTWSKAASSSLKIKPASLAAAAAVDRTKESTIFFIDAQLGVLFK